MPEPQALAVVESLEQTMTSELATKTDLQQLRDHSDREFVLVQADIQQLRVEIRQLRADMEREFAAVRAEMARGFEEQMQGRAADVALLRAEMNAAISRASMRSTVFMMAWTSLLFAAMQFLGS